jgi:hypothetical protein
VGEESATSTMPLITALGRIVHAWKTNGREAATFEDHCNTSIHFPLINLALGICKHSKKLGFHRVKTLTIDPNALARAREGLHRGIIDHVITLKPEVNLKQAWGTLEPLSLDVAPTRKSWNHVTRDRSLRSEPIAIHVETKGPCKSWTDGKAQIAIYTDAWLKRLSLLPRAKVITGTWPRIPLLIAQGHDWHLLIISKDDKKMVFRDQIAVGSTRSCFDAMIMVEVLHWCMKWAETVWRLFFLSLIGEQGVGAATIIAYPRIQVPGRELVYVDSCRTVQQSVTNKEKWCRGRWLATTCGISKWRFQIAHVLVAI